ncbi:MAG TPA: GtrA family protein [Micromonosporaceae bacterium]
MPVTATGSQPSPSGTRRGLIGSLLDRFGHLMHEMGKFGAVGGVAFVVDLALFNIAAHSLRMESLAAKTLSTVAAATVAFIGNRFWTWRHRPRSSLGREYVLYFFFNAVGLGIGLACLAISHYGLGSIWPRVFRTLLADNIAANIVGTALGTLFRFWSYRRFVFVSPTPARAMTERDRR